jgi:hypothetical protein
LTNEAFWGTTPRQFHFLVERLRERTKREDRRAGGIIAAGYNRHRASEADRLFEWWDFFAEWKPEQKEQTEDEMLATMMLFTEGLSNEYR